MHEQRHIKEPGQMESEHVMWAGYILHRDP